MRITGILILALLVFQRTTAAQTEPPELAPPPVDDAAILTSSYSEMDEFYKGFVQPKMQTFSLNLIPKWLDLKAFYLEKQHATAPLTYSGAESDSTSSNWGRYVDVLATSSHFDGKLVGEGEFAYGALGLPTAPDDRLTMTRLAARGNWDKLGYGYSYRSFGSGFISTNGVKIDRPRDENEIWSEYDLQLFRLKTALSEWREKASDQLAPTRTAGTSLSWSRSTWSASLSSSYSWTGNRELFQSFAFSNGISLAYRPASFLTIQPSLGFREDRDGSGLRTDTPTAGLSVIGSPYSNIQLVGRASYANGVGEDPLKISSTLNAAAGVNWKLGQSFLGDQSLSFQFEYKNDVRSHVLVQSSPANLAGTLQFKVAGF